MKNQNKILMSLLTASVSALASAPALAEQLNEVKQDKSVESTNANASHIDFQLVLGNSQQLTEEQILVKNDIKAQVEAMLTKKAPIMKISESINIVAESYSKNNETIAQQVFEELQLGAVGASCYGNANSRDSTCLVISGQNARNGTARANNCHATCHTACHGACHGSRGWR